MTRQEHHDQAEALLTEAEALAPAKGYGWTANTHAFYDRMIERARLHALLALSGQAGDW